MNLEFIRGVDKRLGPLVCQALLLLRTLLRALRPPPKSDAPRRVLVVKYFGMGTILLASPALRKLKESMPGSSLGILTIKANEPLCAALPCFDECVCLDVSSPVSMAKTLAQALSRISKGGYDTVIDLEFLTNFSALTTLLATAFCGASRAVGFNSPLRWRNRVYSSTVSFDHSRHITRIFLKAAATLNPAIKDDELSFEPEKEALERIADFSLAESLMKEASGRRLVCVNVNTGFLSLHRRWPAESFKTLVKHILEDGSNCVALLGGKDDKPYVDEFAKSLGPAERLFNVAGATNFRTLLGVLAKSGLFVTNDSGPLHLAHTLGTPTISFFGPETPNLYGPPQKGPHRVFYSDLHCSPCLNIYNSKLCDCEDNVCLKSISPMEVIPVADNLLSQGPERRSP